MKQLFKLETDPEPTILINQARQILNADYLKKCTEEHKMWASNNPYASHRTGELLLRFPPFTGAVLPSIGFTSRIKPPSEKDVVNKALELYNLNKSKEELVQESPAIEPVVKQDIEPELILNQPFESIQQPIEEVPEPAPKNVEYVNKVFDIFKVIDKLANTDPASEPTPPELTPLPVPPIEVITEPEPVPEPIPEPIPEPVPEPILEPVPEPTPEPISEPVSEPEPVPEIIPQTDNPYVAKIEEIFKDIPKQPVQESFTSMLRKTFFGAKTNK
jgi:hypothetical protein